jgi:S-formylglutathione hydrolase FrmB
VLLPRDYEKHSEIFYPTIYTMIHSVPFGFDPEPPSPGNHAGVNPETGLEDGYEFYRSWISDGFPRVIAVSFEQQTPFFPDSYSVNSANNGPYGDAIVREVIPYLERQFRMIPKPYARIVEGASTGGWQALALQLQHPDFFGGAWILQPDPVDFTRYLLVNIYEDENAFTVRTGPFTTAERPMRRTTEGQVVWTLRQLSQFEAVLGSRGRSGYQLQGWEAVYGPVGSDGYPRRLWDPLTGKINREVAEYMREHGYDLLEYTKRNWTTLGPKIRDKLHFFCGDMDNFYLNLAVYRFEEFLQQTENPHYPGQFTYGRPMKGHSWHAWTWAEMVREIAAYIRRNVPPGEDSAGWND